MVAIERKYFDDHATKYWKLSLRTLALALPNKNKITPRFCKANIPNQYTVSRAALKAKSTPRLNALADYNKNNARKKYDRAAAQSPEVFVKRSALKAVYSPRIDMLSRNPVAKLETTYETYKHIGDHFKMAMKKNINLARTSMYREFYWPKSIPKSESEPKLKSCQYTATCPPPLTLLDTWTELQKWCDDNSRPKRVYHSEPILSQKKKPLVELSKHIPFLATPRYISKKYDSAEADQFSSGTTWAARHYRPSERIKELAKPSEREDPPMRTQEINPWAIVKNDQWKPRPRTDRLAQHRQRSAGNNDEKEDPFSVKPIALKAFCSQRTKELAKPRKR